MKYKFPPFTKLVGDSLVYNGDGTFCFYVPKIYFDRGNAKQDGDIVHLFGVLDWSIIRNGKNNGLHRFVLPTIFQTKPSKQTQIKNIKLTSESEVSDYVLFEYEKDAPIFVNIGLTQDVVNIEEFFKVIKSGRLPTTVPYDKFQEYMIDAFTYAGTSYSLHSQLIGIVASRYFRDPKDISKEFRHTDLKSMTGYKLISINDLPKYISPYSSISSENWQRAVVGALVLGDQGTKSPLEKMLMEASGMDDNQT